MITPGVTTLRLILVALIPIIAAQTEANCTDIHDTWMFNSVGLSPCHVAEQLVQPCSPQGFIIPPLPAGNQYFGPTTSQNNSCICTSIYYSLLSACASCQNRTWINWSLFTTNCTSSWLTVYPNTIPANVKVPHWAYLDVSSIDSFSVSSAESAGDGPESTSPAGATSIPSTSTFTLTSNSSPTSSSQSSSSAGPIAGGVVGGVVGLALIAGLAFFFYRRGERHGSGQSNSIMSGPDVLSTSPPPTAWNGSALRPQKLYDPQDPSTFPQNVYTSVPQSLTGSTYTTTRDAHQPNPSATNYRGIPEVYD